MDILALEASTTSVKTMLYHTDTHTVEVASCEHSQNTDPGNRSADEIFDLLMELGRQTVKGKRVDVITLCGTWHNIMVCDARMRPLTPTYFWDFGGAAELCEQLRRDEEYTNSFYHRTGCMVSSIYPAFKLKWLLERKPQLREERFISLGAYIAYRMTGEKVSSPTFLSGSGLLNTHTKEYDTQLLKELGVGQEQFCRLSAYDEAFPLTGEAARLLGLPAGIPVIGPNADGAMNQTGAGALGEGVATLSIGTSGAIRLSTDRPVIPEQPSTWCYLSPKGWLSGAATNGCCSCINWARSNLFPSGTSYEAMEADVSDPVRTPVFLPFIFGERCPGWDNRQRGGFALRRPEHNAHDLYLAVQEGVLFNLYQCYTTLVELVGKPREIKLSGGILNSPRWLQMCADIFGCTMKLDHSMHGSLLGACVVAMEKVGVVGDLREFSPVSGGTVEPDVSKAPLYQEKFRRYLDCYHSM